MKIKPRFVHYILTMPSHELKNPGHDCRFNLLIAFLDLISKNVIAQNPLALFYMFQVRIWCLVGVAEWFTAPCVWHRRSWVQAPNLHQCLRTHLQVRGSKRLGCHADLYTISRCHTRGESDESVVHRWGSMQAGFETQGRCHQKSKIGVSVAAQKGGLMSSKKCILKKSQNMSLFS